MSKIKKLFKVEGMHCTSCAMLIEGELEDIGASAKCSFASEVLEIEYEIEKINEEDIKKAVQKAGYKVIG